MRHTSYRTKLILCLLALSLAHTCAGCAAADDPEVVALIKKHVSPRAVKTLTDENGVERISGIGLPNNRSSLAILPHLGKLERLARLSISYEGLTDEDLEALPPLPKLREFRMGSNHVTDEGLKSLAHMKELRRLMLHNMPIRGTGLRYLEASSKLERLDLGGTNLDDSGISHIVNNFKRLRRFDFPHTNVTIDGFMQLAELPWLTNIAFPNDMIETEGDPKADREAVREVLRKYVRAYKGFKAKARAVGEDVPPDHVGPFGLIE